MGMDEMVVSQINLRIDDVNNRQDSTDSIIESMRKENSDANGQMLAAVNEQTVAFSEIKTKQTIYVSIAVFIMTIVLNFGIDVFKGYEEPEKVAYYDKRIRDSQTAIDLQKQVDMLTVLLNKEMEKSNKQRIINE